jgi:ABC-type branched-subunit amino acid transport system permease subunit
MGKILALLLLVAMAVHIARPLNLPGLRRRGDFWKIAVVAIGAMMVAAVLRP